MGYIAESEELFYGNFRTYKIIKGDTLQTVSQKLGIEARELRRYHNMYCLDADVIEKDFKHHCHFVILAPEKNDSAPVNEEDSLKKVSLGKDNKLPFLPRGISRDYSAAYTFEVGDKIDTMEMAVRVKWIATDSNKYNLFEITRSVNLFIDDNAPDKMIDELSSKIVAVLYPLKIVVDEFGKWIDIHNYDEIVSRWKDKKSEILDYYEGEVVKSYIEHTEYVLENSKRLLASLRYDYFLNTFFNGIHLKYTAEYGFQNDLIFPLEKEIEAVFHVQNKIAPNLDDGGFIKIEQNAHYIDSGFGFLYGYTSSKVNYNAVYFLNSDNYFIEKMNFELNIENDKRIKTTIVIELLDNKKRKRIA